MSVNISKSVSQAAAKDIRELEQKIAGFNNDTIPEDRFKAYRLTRGVYGQRQFGVHMFRTKLPYGRINAQQLRRMGELSNRYATGNLHLTTRQNIQLHYVKLDDSPAVWAGLADVGVTAREACGNTVRNITASAIAGIDPNEPFNVVPYANAAFEYFLRNPICQDMGRKIKIAFSSSESDSAFIYIHDFGFIPKIEQGVKGFKVVVGGGLGAQSIMAQTAYEFLEEDKLIPFMEAALRIFDRYGERAKRNKARMKYLLSDLGLDKWLEMVEEEWKSLDQETIKIDASEEAESIQDISNYPPVEIAQQEKYQQWLQTNTFRQKQEGYYGVYLKVLKGDIDHKEAYKIADVVEQYAASEMRVTVNQGLLVRYVKEEALPILFNAFNALGFAEPGFDSLHDITVCPGTDTCALGVTNSMGLAKVLERVVKEEYPELMHERFLKIKMSGCMNACGQHMIAQLGFHGSSIRVGEKIAPAMQVVIGGGVDIDGTGHIADKIIKIPTRRIPDTVRRVLDDYEDQANDGEYFNAYYTRQGKKYFYDLLKDLGHKDSIAGQDFIDWGHNEEYVQEIGVGECAGVSYDMVSTIINDAEIKLKEAQEAFDNGLFNEASYHAYTGIVIGAKALLLAVDVACNTQAAILSDFDQHLVAEHGFQVPGGSIEQLALQIKMTKPTQAFAHQFIQQLVDFLDAVKAFRLKQVQQDQLAADKLVVDNYYKA
ncbi:MAG: nitrite/sulfite reductase [Chitinophagales bacterium]